MDAETLEALDQQRQSFERDLLSLTSRIETEFKVIAENALGYTNLYSEAVDALLNDIDRTTDQLKEFMSRCEALEDHLLSIEVLSKQISAMRLLCEEVEGKVQRLSK